MKGLVKIQALVRGYLVRKRAAATLHSMQALFRAQTSVRTQRARRSMSKESRFLPEILARKSLVKNLIFLILHSALHCMPNMYMLGSAVSLDRDFVKLAANPNMHESINK